MKRLSTLSAAAAILGLLLGTAQAQSPAVKEFETHAYGGSIAAGEAKLGALATSQNPEAALALGMMRFAGAIERLGQDLYRYGLVQPNMLRPFGVLAWPVPLNPAPEPLNYVTLRSSLERFVRDLDAAKAALAMVGEAPVKIVVDLSAVRLDLNRDGQATDDATITEFFTGQMGQFWPRSTPSMPSPQVPSFVVAFDTTDAYWLRGYCNLLAGIADFLLAHDFHQTFDQNLTNFFSGTPSRLMQAQQRGGEPNPMESDFGWVGDAIAMVHLIQWPVVEPQRLVAVHGRLKEVVALNKLTWASARAETDNDREWLPNPTQTGVLAGMPVTDDAITGWLAIMDQFDAVLDGRLLIPHWRFAQGVNLKRVLLEPQPFDAVLWATGHGALPYLEDGPLASAEVWRRANVVLRGNLLSYAFFFN